jgi:AcrR family transcriptional regulator
MSPRPYRLGRRQLSTSETRGRILGAARELLAGPAAAGFTVDAVAERAGVARMTVYYQFASKRGLLDALFDSLAARGLVDRLRDTVTRAEPFDALAEFIGAFVGFWASDPLVIRRLRALAALDPSVEAAMRAREEARADGLRSTVARLQPGRPETRMNDVLAVLQVLTSFETFDALAGTSRTPEEVATLLIRSAHAVAGLERGLNSDA